MLPDLPAPASPFAQTRIVRQSNRSNQKVRIMVITAAHITPLVALLAGILILIVPRLLNYIVAIYLIFVGIMGLNNVHHFFNWH
jgi:L-asparagine transporter-like permease